MNNSVKRDLGIDSSSEFDASRNMYSPRAGYNPATKTQQNIEKVENVRIEPINNLDSE